MANGLVQIQGIGGAPSVMATPMPAPTVFEGESLICGLDVGSTTCKYTLASPRGDVLAQAYERHNTRQAEKVLQFLTMLEAKHGYTPGRDRVYFTGSGAGIIAPLVGGKTVQGVVAVAAAVDKLHPNVRFVSEIGGEDMKTIFFQGEG
jgi:Activator of 2-hydroxyglutaryl-CoA dehydratase (HSP70-class ATPase domain)